MNQEHHDGDRLHQAISAGVSDGVTRALNDFMKNPENVKAFWKAGYNELTDHAGNAASQWVGKRILTTLVVTAFTACLVWLLRTGAIK